MNKDQVSGKVDHAVGKVEQKVGEAVGNQKLANKGVIDQAKGAATETWGNVKDTAHSIDESRKDAAEQNANQERGKISQAIDETKENVKGKVEDFKQRHAAAKS